MVTKSSDPILTQMFGSNAVAASASVTSRKPGTYPPIRRAPPAAVTFRKERLLTVFIIWFSFTPRPRGESRGEYVDMFHSGRCSRTWLRQYLHPSVSVSSQAMQPPTSIAPIDNIHTEVPVRRPTPLGEDDL